VKVEASSEALDATLRDFGSGQKVFGAPSLRLRQSNRKAVSLCQVDDDLNIRKTTGRANNAEATSNYLSKQLLIRR
jgi:hypothetical protein